MAMILFDVMTRQLIIPNNKPQFRPRLLFEIEKNSAEDIFSVFRMLNKIYVLCNPGNALWF